MEGLPPEVVGAMLEWLGEAELGAVSGLGPGWLEAARRELARRGTALHRPPLLQAASLAGLAVAGNRLPGCLPHGVQRLGIYLDVRGPLPAGSLSPLLGPSVRSLSLERAEVDAECCRLVLESGVRRLALRGGKVSRRGRRLLLAHRELLEELVLQSGDSLLYLADTPGGAPPVRGTPRRARLPPPALRLLSPGQLASLRHLHLTQTGLSQSELGAISDLPLSSLVIRGTELPSDLLAEVFSRGFTTLRSLVLLHSPSLDLQVCRHIFSKPKISKLVLDLRNADSLEGYFSQLYSSTMKTFLLLYSANCIFENMVLLESKSLQTIILKNYKHCCNTEDSFKFIKRKVTDNKITFKYINVRTLQRCTSFIEPKINKY